MDFKNKTVLITGASAGIGRATALKFAQYGAKVILFDIDFEKLKSVKKEVEEFTKDVLIYKCDVSNEEEVYKAFNDAKDKFGNVDILVNNAALWRCWKEFLDTPIDDWKRFIDVNIMGVVYLTKAALPSMLENKYGRIVNVASVAGVYGKSNMVHYAATKGALISFTKSLAKEVADKGVTVNSVSPGTVSDSNIVFNSSGVKVFSIFL